MQRAQVEQAKQARSAELRQIADTIEKLQNNRGQIQERVAQHLAKQVQKLHRNG